MDLRRRHARASDIDSGLLHVVSLRSPDARSFMRENTHAKRRCAKVGPRRAKQNGTSAIACSGHGARRPRARSDSRVKLAMGLADRFHAALIGIAGCATWPAFMAGDIGLTKSNQYDFQKI